MGDSYHELQPKTFFGLSHFLEQARLVTRSKTPLTWFLTVNRGETAIVSIRICRPHAFHLGFFLLMRFPHDDWYLLPIVETVYDALGAYCEQ
jgi:hypothetical protein